MKKRLILPCSLLTLSMLCACAPASPPEEWIGESGGEGGDPPPTQNVQGMVKINGGTFSMGSPESEEWRSDDET